MAADFLSCDHAEEDYIDMAVSSQSSIFCHAMSSPSHHREFEFQMFPSSSKRNTTASPADELFYKGKLLPLHLPPRLQMVEKLLQNSNTYDTYADSFDECFSTPLENTTPFRSCNISPSESCQVSRELNPDEYSTDVVADHLQTSWTRKLKLIKQSSLCSKLKASRTYLKSFFNISGCSSEFSAAASIGERTTSIPKECTKHYRKVACEPFGIIPARKYDKSATRSLNEGKTPANGSGHHRRSFTSAIKRLSTTKSSSFSSSAGSSTSSSSSTSHGLASQSFKLIGNSYSDTENSIQSAIAHCKSSQQQLHMRKKICDIDICSFPSSRIIYEDQERHELCRG